VPIKGNDAKFYNTLRAALWPITVSGDFTELDMPGQVDARLDLKGVTSVRADEIPSVDYYPGVRKRTLFASETPGGHRILQVEIDAGRGFLDLDVHDSGPEYIYVIEGTFGDGVHEYAPGTFIQHPAGSAHIPQSKSGCKLIVILPTG
jgi:quercetin dioxygenase-like cupin family protein